MLMDTTSPFSVTVCWTLRDAPWASPAADPGDSFLIQTYAEAIAPGPVHDFFLGEVEIPCSQVSVGTDLQTIIPVPQGVPACGCFKLTAVITRLRNGLPIGQNAFLDGPVIEFVGRG